MRCNADDAMIQILVTVTSSRVHSREEGQLDGSARVRRSGVGVDGPDRLVLPGRTRGVREHPCPSSDAMPEEGALGVRVLRKPRPDQDAQGQLGKVRGPAVDERVVQPE